MFGPEDSCRNSAVAGRGGIVRLVEFLEGSSGRADVVVFLLGGSGGKADGSYRGTLRFLPPAEDPLSIDVDLVDAPVRLVRVEGVEIDE